MKRITPSVLAVRALNATRRLHLPTYVATRFLLDSLVSHNESGWIRQVLPRKYSDRPISRFHVTIKLKKVNDKGNKEYREFLVPSPTTALTESLILFYLSKSPAFSKDTRVYSYLWPKHRSYAHNYMHFRKGYTARNRDIAAYFIGNKSKVAIVTDIKKFYPNISQKIVRWRFEDALKRGSDIPHEIASAAMNYLDHMLQLIPQGRGIPTGPDLSHVLGDLALQHVDAKLLKKYPNAYFRYVDDFVLIVDSSEANDALRYVDEVLQEEGLTFNEDKVDFETSDVWLKYGPHNTEHVKDNSFEALVFWLKVFIVWHPEKYDSLTNLLADEGFNIPLNRIRLFSSQPSFLRRLKYLLRKKWKVAWQAINATETDLLGKAHRVREDILLSFKDLMSADVPKKSTRRRWFDQNIRYLTNRAVYVLPHDRLGLMLPFISTMPEFAETTALYKLLLYGQVDDIITMPGPAITAGARLLQERRRHLGEIVYAGDVKDYTIETFGTLMLFGVCKSPKYIYDKCSRQDDEYLRFCEGNPPEQRQINDLSYLDEIRTLQMTRNASDSFNMLTTRFSFQEDDVFDALDIGGEYVS